MSFAYRFADLNITSTVAIAGLRTPTVAAHDADHPDRDTVSIRFQSSAPPAPDRVLYRWIGRYEFWLGTIDGDWLIGSKFDGTFRLDPALGAMTLYSHRDPPSAVCCDVLVRRLLPRVVAARGAMTVHAASLAYRGAGLLLLGASGAGKSTATAALAAMPEWDVLSDDLSTVWEASPARVAPAGTGVCLWEASVRALGLARASCHAMPGYDGKYRFEPATPAVTDAVPLRAFVFLAREADLAAPVLTPMRRSEALILAARQLILFNPAAPPMEERATAIARLSRIAKDVPMMRLSYPSRFDALPAVGAALAGLARA